MGNNVTQIQCPQCVGLLAKVISRLRYNNCDVWVKPTGLTLNVFITCE